MLRGARSDVRAQHWPFDTMRFLMVTSVPTETHPSYPLVTIKLLHTIAWLFFVGCILA